MLRLVDVPDKPGRFDHESVGVLQQIPPIIDGKLVLAPKRVDGHTL